MATSKLQRKTSEYLSRHLGQYTIRENHRPPWMNGLELDFFIDELNVGIEVQGGQHQEYTPYFHKDYDDFLAQKKRDADKKEICNSRDIKIFYVFNNNDIEYVIEQITGIEYNHPMHKNAIEQFVLLGQAVICDQMKKKIKKDGRYKSLLRSVQRLKKIGFDTNDKVSLLSSCANIKNRLSAYNETELYLVNEMLHKYKFIIDTATSRF